MEWDPSRWEDMQRPDTEAEDGADKGSKGPNVISKSLTSPYLPFGAGRHRCPGELYAYAQMGAIIATMVRLMEWEQVDPNAPVPPPDYSVSRNRLLRLKCILIRDTVNVLAADDSSRYTMAFA
jgi:sterol 14-demethylase